MKYKKWYQTLFETICFKKGNEIIDVTLAEDDEQRDINEYPDVTLADVTIAHDDGQFKARHFHYFLTSIQHKRRSIFRDHLYAMILHSWYLVDLGIQGILLAANLSVNFFWKNMKSKS